MTPTVRLSLNYCTNSLLVTANGGGSNGSRVRLLKLELQKLAGDLVLPIIVCHLPPGARKWNRIEHRLFSFIIGNWRGKPLVSHQVIVQLIAATTAAINLTRHFFHGEWNYAINPNPPARKR